LAFDYEIDPGLGVDDFDYELPAELIAQTPLERRDDSRLLVVDRASRDMRHAGVRDLPRLLDPGDLMVVNNSRVIPARLSGRKAETGGRVELLLLREEGDGSWAALARPARRLAKGTVVRLEPRGAAATDEPELAVEVVEGRDEGQVLLRVPPGFEQRLARFGATPLPPYITRELEENERYQTVYARSSGSAAAPTAGLHLTPELIDALRARGIGWAEVTLHVGLDTFRPVAVEKVREHAIHREWCSVPASTAAAIAATKAAGKRVVAVGTTSARTLESFGARSEAGHGGGMEMSTGLFIVPGYRWRVVDALLTNFHLPRSTLLMMVSSFAGRDLVQAAYREAIRERYRFYSFGDAMLLR